MRTMSSFDSQSSSGSDRWLRHDDFPRYEDLFHRPRARSSSKGVRGVQVSVVERAQSFDHESALRDLLHEMRDWYVDNTDEACRRLNKVCILSHQRLPELMDYLLSRCPILRNTTTSWRSIATLPASIPFTLSLATRQLPRCTRHR